MIARHQPSPGHCKRSTIAGLLALWLAVALVFAGGLTPVLAQQQQTPAGESAPVLVPPAQGQQNDAEMWRALRQGAQGYVSIPDKKAGVLVQSEGQNWRVLRNGPVSTYGVWLLLLTIALLALFFALRGRIRIEHGRSGRLILRFAGFERLVHWTVAVSFILLALTGLNLLYGRYLLPALIGAKGFALVTAWGKYLHDYVGFVFIAGLALMLVMWLRYNAPKRVDWIWLKQGGGMFGRGLHPPAYKFNAGQKLIFLAVIGFGALISFSGLSLMLPFSFGYTVQDMQLLQLSHSIAALILTAVILAHIYIGSIGMEGAFEAMASGTVDENWAREHHSLWVEELEAEARTPAASGAVAPAE